jgi:hypothetical protein
VPPEVVTIPVSVIALDTKQVAERDTSFVLAHLTRYFSKFDPLPMIGVRIDGAALLVTRNPEYVEAARALGRPRIRALVESHASPEDLERFLARSDVERLDWKVLLAEMDAADPSPMAWHVVYFERPLSVEEKQAFDREVALVGTADAMTAHVHHDDAGPVAELEAVTHVHDRRWVNELGYRLNQFSRNHVRIVSYQGRKYANSLA